MAFTQELDCGSEAQHLKYRGTSVPSFEISIKRLIIRKLSIRCDTAEFELRKRMNLKPVSL